MSVLPVQHQKINSVKKIAVLRAGAIGDFIVTLPAITGLRYAYPEAEIVLLGTSWQKDFLISRRTVIDRVVVVPANEQAMNEFIKQPTV
jgi:ADP-heptose:LPS heptosyltransferase